MSSLDANPAIDWRRYAAARELVPWLLLSVLIHVALMQLAPLGSAWGCCGGGESDLNPDAATPALVVRLVGAVANRAEPAGKTEPARTTHTNMREDVVANTGDGIVPYYYSPQDLGSKPQATTEILIADPGTLAGTTSGSVVLELFINEAGGMDRVRVESASLPEPFQNIAAEAFRQSVFTPGLKDGKPVKSRLRVEVTVEDVASEIQQTEEKG